MPELLATAEAYGFGPPSKLHAICGELAGRGFRSHYLGQDVSLTFAQVNHQGFASITPVPDMADLGDVPPDRFDGALSVMDPYLALWASYHGVPCVYVDSLYWFWRWDPEQEADLRRIAAELRAAPTATEALRRLATIPMHDSQYIAHHLSTVTCAQRSPGTAARSHATEGHRRVEVVDAIVDLSHRQPVGRYFWLATTSGLLNPLMPVDSAMRWLRIATRLLEDAAAASGSGEPVMLAGNPQVLNLADSISDRIRLTPLDHRGILRAMNSALAVLTPPGLTTMLECAAYGAPFLFLPEQHYGHVQNYREITRCGPVDAFPQALLNADGNRSIKTDMLVETRAIIDQLGKHFDGRDATWSRMVAATAAGMTAVRRDSDHLYQAQEAAVRGFVGGYSGTSQVANVLESLVEQKVSP